MAKQKKKRNKRNRYTTDSRLDMRTGGRVSFKHGGPHGRKKTMEEPILVNDDNNRRIPVPTPKKGVPVKDDPIFTPQPQPTPQPEPTPMPSINGRGREPGIGFPPPDDFRDPPIQVPPIDPPKEDPPPPPPPVDTPPTEVPITGTKEQFEEERGKRVTQTGRTAEQIAAGQIPEGMIPQMEAEKISMQGTEADTVRLGQTQRAEATTLGQPTSEQVAQMTATTAKTPEQIEAAQMTAAQITDKPDVQAALGDLSSEALAKVNEIRELSGPAEAARISETIANAAKANTVDGVLSAGAFAPEVTGVGA